MKRKRKDRLSLLPDALLISILSYIDTKLAVQCSVLSKRWVNLWTLIPVLNLSGYGFFSGYKFNIFIDKVLSGRNDLIKVDSVNLKVTFDHPIVDGVFDYVLLHGVRNVSIDTCGCSQSGISCDTSSNLLISLSLNGRLNFGRFLNFNGLVSLRLEGVRIINSEPFSSFPNLEELVLVNCQLLSDLDGIKVIGTQLSSLTISSCSLIRYKKLVLLTPKLVSFELKGHLPMQIKAFELPVLDIAHIDSFARGLIYNRRHKPSCLITVLQGLTHAISIHLSPSTVKVIKDASIYAC